MQLLECAVRWWWTSSRFFRCHKVLNQGWLICRCWHCWSLTTTLKLRCTLCSQSLSMTHCLSTPPPNPRCTLWGGTLSFIPESTHSLQGPFIRADHTAPRPASLVAERPDELFLTFPPSVIFRGTKEEAQPITLAHLIINLSLPIPTHTSPCLWQARLSGHKLKKQTLRDQRQAKGRIAGINLGSVL